MTGTLPGSLAGRLPVAPPGNSPVLPPPPIGWPLLPVPAADGTLSFPSLADSVRQQIEVILRTAPGDQLMRPDFGAGLERMLEQPNSLATRARIQERITDALSLWEPRILLDRVEVDSAANSRELLVVIAYRLRRTSEAASLSVRMPIGGGAG
jgi:phage baseplate assembly protein W